MKHFLLASIRLYQHSRFFRQPIFRSLFLTDAVCRFQPSCSQYCYQALNQYPLSKSLFLCLKRIIRCHPWSKGGVDPLP